MIERVAARVLVLDAAGAVLLLRGVDPARPDAGHWWFTPGGGLELDETPEQGARRELFEETGLHSEQLEPVGYVREANFRFEGVDYHQTETFFWVRVARFELDSTNWSDIEQRSVLGHRWWARDEIVTTNETMYPERLAELLADLAGQHS